MLLLSFIWLSVSHYIVALCVLASNLMIAQDSACNSLGIYRVRCQEAKEQWEIGKVIAVVDKAKPII